MSFLKDITSILLSGRDMSREEAAAAALSLASPDVEADVKCAFLVALSKKGESADEVAAFASTFRDLAVDPEVGAWASDAVDVCGTGGDGAHTFNISTAVSFIVAAAGVPVFKHGNRSITSKCGSADLLEALGIKLQGSKETIHTSLEELNFCFFFAPAYHPAFREIMPVRKSLAETGQRTIFNLLGPLINPGRPSHQLLGVFAHEWVDPLASALHSLGLRAGLVVHCLPEENKALDELSCAGRNIVSGFGDLESISTLPELDTLGLRACTLDELKGGDVDMNMAMLHALFSCDTDAITPGLFDSVLLNAGAAIWASGKAIGLLEGVQVARELLLSGAVSNWLARAQSFYSKY
ncbi:MAG: anthranilate phosphoribosyltransferase [Opitutales bacterium]